MDISIFLAKLIGLYFLILGVLSVLRSRQIKIMGKDFASSPITLAVSAEISLLFGLVIAIDHSIWEYNWKGLITVLGYLMILRGILRFAFPQQVKKMVTKMTNRGFWLSVILMLVIGGLLTYRGFTS